MPYTLSIKIEARFFAAYKRVRNQLRKHKPEDIFLRSIHFLNLRKSKLIDELNKQPWLVFLLLKWTVIDDEFNTRDKKSLDAKSFEKIRGLMRELGKYVRMPDEYESLHLYFRTMAFQQVWYHREFQVPAFARQSLIFGSLPKNHQFHKKFLEKTGISINDYIELAIILLTRFVVPGDKDYILRYWFSSIEGCYPSGAIDKFLSLISSDIVGLRRKFLETDKSFKNRSYEYYEHTQFVKTPLLYYKERYFCYYRPLLYICLEQLIYDTLREINPNKFMDSFGGIFEKYTHQILIKLYPDLLTESDLSDILPGEGKLVDFLIYDDGASILIDAKGVEMHHLGNVSHRPDIILHKTRSSVLKGIEQGFAVIDRFFENRETINFNLSDENYLLIVTFKDLYLGNGKDFYENVAAEKLNFLKDKHKYSDKLPIEHIYFISIDTLDILCETISSKKISLATFFRQCIFKDSNPKLKMFDTYLHVASINQEIDIQPHLLEEHDRIMSKLSEKLKDIDL